MQVYINGILTLLVVVVQLWRKTSVALTLHPHYLLFLCCIHQTPQRWIKQPWLWWIAMDNKWIIHRQLCATLCRWVCNILRVWWLELNTFSNICFSVAATWCCGYLFDFCILSSTLYCITSDFLTFFLPSWAILFVFLDLIFFGYIVFHVLATSVIQ